MPPVRAKVQLVGVPYKDKIKMNYWNVAQYLAEQRTCLKRLKMYPPIKKVFITNTAK